jgi:hypothetical protein
VKSGTAFLRQASGEWRQRLSGVAAVVPDLRVPGFDYGRDIFFRGLFGSEVEVVIAGGGVIAEAWRGTLAQSSMRVITLSDSEVENAMLTGLRLRKFLSRSLAPHLKSISKSA